MNLRVEDFPVEKVSRKIQNKAVMWTCHLCNTVITPAERPLHRLRANHLRARHPDTLLRGTKLHMRFRVNVIIAFESIPLSERSWNCPFCPAGLPSMESRCEKSIKHHYETVHHKQDTSLKARINCQSEKTC